MTAVVKNGGSETGKSADDCADQLAVASQQLLKTLDALEKSEALVGFKDKEIAARVQLDNLKDQIIAVKDIIISTQDELIKRLQKNSKGFMARLKSILSIAEKVALLAAGFLLAR